MTGTALIVLRLLGAQPDSRGAPTPRSADYRFRVDPSVAGLRSQLARKKRKLSSVRLRSVGQAEPLRCRMQPSVAGP